MSLVVRRHLLAVVLSLIVAHMASAADKGSVPEQRVAWLREKVDAVRVFPTRESNDACQLREEPIIKWSNPVSGAEGASRLTGYQIRGWHNERLVLDVEKIQSPIRTASLFHRV